MELNDIITLAKAGFTKDEISKLVSTVPSAANLEPVPVDPAAPAAEPEPEPVNEPVVPAPANPVPEQHTPEEGQPSISDVMKSIARLTSAIQANAIQTSFIPGGNPNQPDAAATLAEIIRPTRKERG